MVPGLLVAIQEFDEEEILWFAMPSQVVGLDAMCSHQHGGSGCKIGCRANQLKLT